MHGSKIVAAFVTLGIVGGGALALAKSGEAAKPREALCSSRNLALADQDSCVTQMKAARTEVEKQQVVTRFQSKIDAREAALAARDSASTSSSGGVSAKPDTATSGSLNQPDSKVSNNANMTAKGVVPPK